MATANYSAWLGKLQENLERAGPEGVEALQLIKQRHTRLGVHDQPTGARWTIGGRIELHPRFAERPPDDPGALGLIIHEARHLRQGLWTALSVYGELEAWQLQFTYMKSQTGSYDQDPRRNAVLERLIRLPLDWERAALAQAVGLMKEYAGQAYRIDLLPYYPLPAEIRYRLTGRQPLLG